MRHRGKILTVLLASLFWGLSGVVAVMLTPSGLDGDHQSWHEHGGVEKALLHYAAEHYRIGCDSDTSVVLEVSQPRQPCWKLAHNSGQRSIPALMQQRAATGWYYRVITPGLVRAGATIELISRPCPGVRGGTPPRRGSRRVSWKIGPGVCMADECVTERLMAETLIYAAPLDFVGSLDGGDEPHLCAAQPGGVVAGGGPGLSAAGGCGLLRAIAERIPPPIIRTPPTRCDGPTCSPRSRYPSMAP